MTFDAACLHRLVWPRFYGRTIADVSRDRDDLLYLAFLVERRVLEHDDQEAAEDFLSEHCIQLALLTDAREDAWHDD